MIFNKVVSYFIISKFYKPSYRAGLKRICSSINYRSFKPNFIKNKSISFHERSHTWIYYSVWSVYDELGFEKNCIIKFGLKSIILEIYKLKLYITLSLCKNFMNLFLLHSVDMGRQCSIDQFILGPINMNCSDRNKLNSECDIVCKDNKELYYKKRRTKTRIKCLLGDYQFEWKIITNLFETQLLRYHYQYLTCESPYKLTVGNKFQFETTSVPYFLSSMGISIYLI